MVRVVQWYGRHALSQCPPRGWVVQVVQWYGWYALLQSLPGPLHLDKTQTDFHAVRVKTILRNFEDYAPTTAQTVAGASSATLRASLRRTSLRRTSLRRLLAASVVRPSRGGWYGWYGGTGGTQTPCRGGRYRVRPASKPF